MKPFKIKMLNTVKPVNDYDKKHHFHKGRTYNAQNATNQPNWRENGLIFVYKTTLSTKVEDGEVFSMLISQCDYEKVY